MELYYEHKAKYHETDQMGIIHHSNYIKWMEEARIDFLSNMGFSYRKMEELGIISPVLEINCQYKDMVKFDDNVIIKTTIKIYNGIKVTISYQMKNDSTGKICAICESTHCFLTKEGKLLSLSKNFPDIDKIFKEFVNKN